MTQCIKTAYDTGVTEALRTYGVKIAITLPVASGLLGAGLGAISGALGDSDNRLRGAAIGAGLGGLSAYGGASFLTNQIKRQHVPHHLAAEGITRQMLDRLPPHLRHVATAGGVPPDQIKLLGTTLGEYEPSLKGVKSKFDALRALHGARARGDDDLELRISRALQHPEYETLPSFRANTRYRDIAAWAPDAPASVEDLDFAHAALPIADDPATQRMRNWELRHLKRFFEHKQVT